MNEIRNSALYLLTISFIFLSACASTKQTSEDSSLIAEKQAKQQSTLTTEEMNVAPPPAAVSLEQASSVGKSDQPASQASDIVKKSKIKGSNTKTLNIRPTPSTEKAPLALIKGGTAVEVLEVTGKWLKIRWILKDVEKTGWIRRQFVVGY